MNGKQRRELQTATQRAATLEKGLGDLRAQLGRIWEEQLRDIRSEARNGQSQVREEKRRVAERLAAEAFKLLYLAAVDQPAPTSALKVAIAQVSDLMKTGAYGASSTP